MSNSYDLYSTQADLDQSEMITEVTATKHSLEIVGDFNIDILVHFDGIPHNRFYTDWDGNLKITWPEFVNPKAITLYAIGRHAQIQEITFPTPKHERMLKVF